MDADIEDLAEAWPRPLIAAGSAAPLARWWVGSRADAVRAGKPAFARHTATSTLLSVLFEIRRARWLVRGLEDATRALVAQERGLRQSPATQVAQGRRRVSRLLVLSNDGAPRFYRDVEKLCDAHASRLEAIVLDCDEETLGAAIFGSGRAARAVLLDHKEAVIHFLEQLEPGS